MKSNEGLFIVLEGGEGAGKSTLSNMMRESFEGRGYEVVNFREPGGTDFAENIRDLYLNTEGLDGETVAMLMNAARIDNIQKVILPSLSEGKIVIADRFSASTLVYQGIRKGIYDEVSKVTKHIPMISIFVDLDAEEGIKRIFENNRETNRLDLLPIETHQLIHEGYLSLSEKMPEVYWDYIIDGSRSLDELGVEIDIELVQHLSEALEDGYTTEEIKGIIRNKEKVYA